MFNKRYFIYMFLVFPFFCRVWARNFLNENTVFLEDSLLGTIHNLSESDYNFISEVGAFDTRFRLVFVNKTLSIEDDKKEETVLKIIDLNNGDIQISVNNNETINKVEIIDFAGRTLYRFNGFNGSEMYNISALSPCIYLVRIQLSNGQVLVKKAIKKG